MQTTSPRRGREEGEGRDKGKASVNFRMKTTAYNGAGRNYLAAVRKEGRDVK